MEPLLYLVHRIPYPPNKGDKIRSYHLLRYLAERFNVYLGCFVDAREDGVHVEKLRSFCSGVCAIPLDRRLARLRSLAGFITGEALTLPYYRSSRLQAWVDHLIVREAVAKAVAFSSPMAQYLLPHPELRAVVDLVDVDSAKWTSYAQRRPWPLSSVLRREGKRLLEFERRAVTASAAGVFVTSVEASLFKQLAPECARQVHAVGNGVDSHYFSPQADRPSPFAPRERAIVFTGAMDYWPNVDAVTWFAREILPRLRQVDPAVRFYVVGMNPVPEVAALADAAAVVVTGRVDDVRPYLQHAAAVVAPLRVARGIQNKVLEAMAMGRPVVASSEAFEGIHADPGGELEVADGVDAFVSRTLAVLEPARASTLGAAARAHVVAEYSWAANLDRFGTLLDDASARPQPTDYSAPQLALAR